MVVVEVVVALDVVEVVVVVILEVVEVVVAGADPPVLVIAHSQVDGFE